MTGSRSTVIYGGGTVFLLLLILFFVMAMPFPVAEALPPGGSPEQGTSLGGFVMAAGAAGWFIILLGIAAVILTMVGSIAVQGERPWRHWRSLIRGLGEAAFLVGISGTILGMIQALDEVARLGASVTPRDMSYGISSALVTVLFGSVVALGTVIGSGVVALFTPKPAD